MVYLFYLYFTNSGFEISKFCKPKSEVLMALVLKKEPPSVGKFGYKENEN